MKTGEENRTCTRTEQGQQSSSRANFDGKQKRSLAWRQKQIGRLAHWTEEPERRLRPAAEAEKQNNKAVSSFGRRKPMKPHKHGLKKLRRTENRVESWRFLCQSASIPTRSRSSTTWCSNPRTNHKKIELGRCKG
jgi:hypothetical protein